MSSAQTQVWSEASSDAELISAVRAGDTAAYGALYERHAAAALTVARQYVRSRADADDVVADAFARTLGVLQNGGGPDVTFRAYLFTAVRRLSYDLVNGSRRTQPTDDDRTFENAFGPMASTEDPALAGFERSIVARAYESLPERWRAVLWYTEVENLPPAEIAPILGITANGVAALSYRAREGLRQAYLQQHLGGQPGEECQGVNPLLGSYVRGGLAKRETARVESHLDGCGECRGLVLELGDVSHGMRSVIAPLVLGVGALGLVGTALPVSGGSAVGAGATGAAGSASGGASGGGASGGGVAGGTAGGTTAGGAASGATGTGGAAAGTAATTGGVAGTAGTGAATGAGAAAGTAAVGAGASTAGGAALASAGGLAALVSAAPLASAAVALGVLTVTGLGIAGALGVFSPDEPEPAPTVQASPAPTDDTGSDDPTATDPALDPASPSNIPPQDPDAPAVTEDTATDTTADEPAATAGPDVPEAPATASGPVAAGGGVVDPPAAPAPGTPPTPQPPPPAPASLDLTLGVVDLAARVSAPLPITVQNTGGQAANDVAVDVILPAGVRVADESSSLGAAVGTALSAASLPCGAASMNDDGSSTVTCAVGKLGPSETGDVSVPVWADDGGDYTFAGSVRATGLEPVRKTFNPRSVKYYGPQLRITADYGQAGPQAFSTDNPGAATVRLTVRNSGDRDATDPTVDLQVPAGLSLLTGTDGMQKVTGGWTCAPAGGAATCVAPSGTTLGAKQDVTLPVRLVADDAGDTAGGRRTLTASGTATDPREGKGAVVAGESPVVVDVGGYWEGALEGLVGNVEAQCTAPGNADTASLVVPGFRNLTAYDDLSVTLEGAGSSATEIVKPGDEEVLKVDDGVRFAAGSARLLLSTAVAGQIFEHELDAGTFPATDCWSVPPWLTDADADVVARNVGGTVRYTAHVENVTGTAMDVRLLAPDSGPWSTVADSATVTPLRTDSTADLELDTKAASMPAATATLRQYRFHRDADGDGQGYQELLDVALPAETIAPAAPAPTVGACVFDPETDASSAPVTITLDNRASTLPVTFSVPGVQTDVEVAAGSTLDVATTVGSKGTTVRVVADGHDLDEHVVAGVDCFDWGVLDGSTTADAQWVVGKGGSTGSTVLTGTFRNPYAATTLQVSMAAGSHGTTDVVDVAPGEEATFTLGIRSRDVAAGTATFTAERARPAGPGSGTTSAAFAASTYEPSWATVAQVTAEWDGESVKLVGTLTNDTDETLDARMLGGSFGDTTPVQKIAPDQSATFEIDSRSLDLKAGSVSFRQYRYVIDKGFADTALRASYDGARYEPDWSATPTASTVCTGDLADSATLTASLRNDSPESMHVTARTPLGEADLGVVAPGATGTVELGAGALAVDAGTATFTLSREHLGQTFTHEVAADFAELDCTVVAPAATEALGAPYYDETRDHSYRAVSVVLDNSGSNVPVTFRATGHAKGSWDLAAGERRTVELGEVDWNGATYVLHASSWSHQVKVERFTAAPACYEPWQRWTGYDHSAVASDRGWNYAARNGSYNVRPGGDVFGLFWERESRCGEG
ncbi:sigma-70 family RNA polymerase sigma factor [Cellulosimicrobium arenosum]|uniref:Sigma-70 family RNA polymerase sigma factor n=1 Tax=Cellulosimicrobium arenosum TaxID=2708133 RepID=A0A927PDU9_9MICO|nr:sigma-70 family RNA polymerase sigma factor [Cellulosimicrobium arenosum]MBD8079833.1 sigma-70 family RNA polymerase sigma factor [Cellulosimicrobium arenosum]